MRQEHAATKRTIGLVETILIMGVIILALKNIDAIAAYAGAAADAVGF
jgi:hypothetical protein